MIYFQNILVYSKLFLYFQCINPISILLTGTMGLRHIPHTITYTTNRTPLKNKRKLNDAINLLLVVHTYKYIYCLYYRIYEIY